MGKGYRHAEILQETRGHERTLENQDFWKEVEVGNEMITTRKKNAKKSTARRYISTICIDLSFFVDPDAW